jgi:pimeloyl-ACP methyl ester carboxylesterase
MSPSRTIPKLSVYLLVAITDFFLLCSHSWAWQVQSVNMLNGMQHEGVVGTIAEISESLTEMDGPDGGHLITIIDDGLRRIYVNKQRIANFNRIDKKEERFPVWQKSTSGDTGVGVGSIVSAGPFDKYGRRTLQVRVANRVDVVIQGITLITPRFCVVENLPNEGGANFRWTMHIATSSVPIDTVLAILKRQIKNPTGQAERLQIVDFLIQAGRYKEAEKEVREIRALFPDRDETLKNYEQLISRQVARQTVDEMRRRWEVGQRQFATDLLEIALKATSDSAILAMFESLHEEISRKELEVVQLKTNLIRDIEIALQSEKIDAQTKATISNFKSTVPDLLSIDNIGRMDAYKIVMNVADKPVEEKISLALSCWYAGTGVATENLAISESMPNVRDLVVEYLQTNNPVRRDQILGELLAFESGAPKYISAIIAHILPPVPVDLTPSTMGRSIELMIEIPPAGGTGPNEKVPCLVQLPPEYNPYRWYPAIMSLTNPGRSLENQIDWWCGPLGQNATIRHGQATRHGYIVIAPLWHKLGQSRYEFSAREHAVVLESLRDSLRRFSIDPDRVFLAGLGVGGDAAADIALAHPEHWAGVIPISARLERYAMFYYINAGSSTKDSSLSPSRLPMYFVQGERDYDSFKENCSEWNRWVRNKDYDVTVVEYKGRGDDFFYDEIHYLFDWMNAIEDRLSLSEIEHFTCSILRPWDNYHYWYEGADFDSKFMINPDAWTLVDSSNRSDREIDGSVNVAENSYKITRLGNRGTVWLSPEITDFDRPIKFSSNKDATFEVRPSRQIILEDVRRRADRQHPFWAKVERIQARWIEPPTENR